MNQNILSVARFIASQGYTAAVVGPNQIETDAPEDVCRNAVAMTTPTSAAPQLTRHRAKATAAPAAPRRKRRKSRRRTAKPKTIRPTTRRRKRGKLTGAAKAAFLARMHGGRKSGTRKTRKTRKTRTTKRRVKKTWTAAMRQAFAAKMKAARAFYKKAKR